MGAQASFTEEGRRRLILAEDGPVLVTSAVMDARGGGRFPVSLIPDQSRVILAAPPEGCHMTGADLLAEDGIVIIRVEGDVILCPGDNLALSITLE